METKEIVERVLKGEDHSSLLKDVPVEKQLEVQIAIRDALSSTLQQGLGDKKKLTEDLIGLRTGIDKIKEKQNESVNTVLDTFKKEQVLKATKKFFSDPRYPVTTEQKAQIEAELQTKGIQSTDADFVFEEIKKIYGALNVDALIADKEKAAKGASGAARFNSGAAGASNSGPSGDPDKYSQPVRDLWEAVVKSGHKNFTLDQAKEQFEKGRNISKRTLS